MNEFVKFIAGLGIPGLALLVAMGVVGFSGAAAITAALALLGGPLGMLGGIGALGALGVFSWKLSQYGFEKVYKATVDELVRKGKTKAEVIREIRGYMITQSLKEQLIGYIQRHWPCKDS